MRLRNGLRRLLRISRVRRRVAMLHTGRCGSTVLGNMLNQHREVHWGGELFDQLMPTAARPAQKIDPRAVIRGAELTSGKPVFGFDTKYLSIQHLCPECVNMPVDRYCDLLQQMGYDKFIVLHRKNYLRRAVSVEVGRIRNKWHDTVAPAVATRVRMAIDALQTGHTFGNMLALFDCIDAEHAQLMARLRGCDVLHMVYEDDILESPQSAYKKSCEFLGLPVEPARVTLERSTPFRLDEVIENYDEVRDSLRGTRHEWMLSDHV